MVPDDVATAPDAASKTVPGASSNSVTFRKQPKLKKSSGSATNIARPSASRKLSGSEYVNAKGQAGLASSAMRRSLSQHFVRDYESSLQRPSKPLQIPVQLPLQLPASKVQLAAVGTRKWLKIEASGATSILQVSHEMTLPTPACVCSTTSCHGVLQHDCFLSSGRQVVHHATAWHTSSGLETIGSCYGHLISFCYIVSRKGAAGQHGAHQVYHHHQLPAAVKCGSAQCLAVCRKCTVQTYSPNTCSSSQNS